MLPALLAQIGLPLLVKAVGSALLDELPLECDAVVVRHAPQSPDVERSH